MVITRKKQKNVKKMCVYIWQEKNNNTIDTHIDYIGDCELYDELKKSIMREIMINYT